jgi:hypothetical protein
MTGQMTGQQAHVIAEHQLTVVARCTGRSRSLIVRLRGDPRLFYLSPSGLFRRCR